LNVNTVAWNHESRITNQESVSLSPGALHLEAIDDLGNALGLPGDVEGALPGGG
jgi:hypothetical protein